MGGVEAGDMVGTPTIASAGAEEVSRVWNAIQYRWTDKHLELYIV